MNMAISSVPRAASSDHGFLRYKKLKILRAGAAEGLCRTTDLFLAPHREQRRVVSRSSTLQARLGLLGDTAPPLQGACGAKRPLATVPVLVEFAVRTRRATMRGAIERDAASLSRRSQCLPSTLPW